MRKWLITLFVIFAPAAWACDIPRNVRIPAPDPCAAFALIQADWQMVLKRVWFASHVHELFTGAAPVLPTEALADMGEIRFVARAGEYFYDPVYGGNVYGFFTPTGTPTIEYAEGTPAVLRHEMAHWFYWRHRR